MSVIESRTELAERIELLARVPIFSTFTPAELEWLAPRFDEVLHPKGEVLFNEGDEGGDFFVVVRGELEVWGGAAEKRVVNRLRAGDHLGEIALLLGGRRTATVRVARAARLLTMDAAGFHELLEHNPKVLGFIASNLSRQLDARTRGEVATRATLSIAVSGSAGLKGKTLISNALAALLARQTELPVLVIDVAHDGGGGVEHRTDDVSLGATRPGPGAASRLTLAASRSGNGAPSLSTLESLIERAHEQFRLVILDLGSHEAAPPRRLSEICDVVVELIGQAKDELPSGYGSSTRVLPVVNLHNAVSKPFAVNRCAPFLLRDEPALSGRDANEQAAYIRDHPRSPAAPALHRLARKLRGATVGVALAGGSAFGIAHIGVLQVLEEAGVPVDIVSGTSMGSIIGALYATGMPARELADVAVRMGTVRTAISALDLTVARPGLLAGRNLTGILRQLGLTGRFEDLALPYEAITCDIERGEVVPIVSGELASACRASASLPAVFAPVRRDGRILVDGGVIDNVPVTQVREMGADLCIAVTVIPTLRPDAKTVFTRISNRVNALNPLSYLAGARGMPTMFDVVMNTIQLLQYQFGSYQALAADAHIEVDASDFTWVDFHRAPDLIERGASTAEQVLPVIQRMLAERPVLAG